MAFNGFIQFDGISGESSDSDHEDWSNIVGYSCGVTMDVSPATATDGLTGGRSMIHHLNVTKLVDNSSVELRMKCATGEVVDTVIMELCAASGDKEVFYKLTLEPCLISAVTDGGSTGSADNRPVEDVTIAYEQITWEYTPIGGETIERIFNVRTDSPG